MRIGVEADRIWANRFGSGRFVREAVRVLQTECPQHEYTLFSFTYKSIATRRAFSPVRLLRGIRRFTWLQTGLPFLLPLDLSLTHVEVTPQQPGTI